MGIFFNVTYNFPYNRVKEYYRSKNYWVWLKANYSSLVKYIILLFTNLPFLFLSTVEMNKMNSLNINDCNFLAYKIIHIVRAYNRIMRLYVRPSNGKKSL